MSLLVVGLELFLVCVCAHVQWTHVDVGLMSSLITVFFAKAGFFIEARAQ